MEDTEDYVIEKYVPHKTPYSLLENFRDLISGHSFYEIGCGFGHILNYVSNNLSPKTVSGCENRSTQVNYTKKHFPSVTYDDVFSLEKLPDSDIYYVWSSFSFKEYKKIIYKIPKSSLFLINFHLYSPRCNLGKKFCKGCGESQLISDLMHKLLTYCKCSFRDTYYDEKSIHKCRNTGIFRTLIVEPAKVKKFKLW